MARVRVMEGQRFPDVCAKTGVPTTNRVRLSGRAEPAWVAGLFFFGFLAYLFASRNAAREYSFAVPVLRDVMKRHATWTRVSRALIVAGIVGFFISLAGNAIVGAYFLILVPIGLIVDVWNTSRHGLRVILERDNTLTLSGVYPTFAAAVVAQRSGQSTNQAPDRV